MVFCNCPGKCLTGNCNRYFDRLLTQMCNPHDIYAKIEVFSAEYYPIVIVLENWMLFFFFPYRICDHYVDLACLLDLNISHFELRFNQLGWKEKNQSVRKVLV